MYKDPIKVDSNDPLLSATSLEGTVIGILFEKSGEEIKAAIQSRVTVITEEIRKNVEVVTPIREFLKSKEAEIAEIEVYEQNRRVEKDEKLKPIFKKKEEAEEVVRKITLEIRDCGKGLDDLTHNSLIEELKKFKSGWDQIDSQLEFLEKANLEALWKIEFDMTRTNNDPNTRVVTNHAFNVGFNGPAGETGPRVDSGISGISGCSGSSSSTSCSTDFGNSVLYCSPIHTPIDWQAAKGEIEVEGTTVSWKLRCKVNEYKKLFQAIKARIESLDLERRRLEMISRNISSDRKFKLSLVQLSAFGFEDLEMI